MKKIDRRRFISSTAIGVGATAVATNLRLAAASALECQETKPFFIATWPFGQPACEAAVKSAQDGSMLDGIVHGIQVTEADISNASVGLGGIPNAAGQVELDACIMSGPGHDAGSVAAIRDVLHPIAVARMVMEDTPHVMLVGENASKFAIENGVPETDLLTDKQKEKWNKWLEEQAVPADGQALKSTPRAEEFVVSEQQHDTIAMLGIDSNGDLYGGCSTSGWGYKIPGRVGDSPIIGSGLYVDNTAGAAGATGLGENVMRYCGSFLVVEFMRNGASPVDACQMAIERIDELDPKGIDELSINFIALGKDGSYGAAGTNKGFKFAWASPDGSGVLESRALTAGDIGPEGGNRK